MEIDTDYESCMRSLGGPWERALRFLVMLPGSHGPPWESILITKITYSFLYGTMRTEVCLLVSITYTCVDKPGFQRSKVFTRFVRVPMFIGDIVYTCE